MGDNAEYKIMGFRKSEEFEFPGIVNIEVFRGACYCRCIHCPIGSTEPESREERFGLKKIDMGLYKNIISQIARHSHSTVRIHSVGDPLLWEELAEALRFTRECGVKSWVFTCAVTNDKEKLEAICKNTDVVEVSVNSINPEDYEATKGINAFNLVSSNVEWMRHYIDRRKLDTRLLVSKVETSDRQMDEKFVKYWKLSGLVSDAFVRSHHTYNNMIAELPEKGKTKHEPCLVHWARFNISVDGYAVVCFNELFKKEVDPSLVLGDLRSQTIDKVWQGSTLNAIRKAELRGDYSLLDFANSLPCKHCYSCQPLFGNRQTSEYQISQLGEENA
jgi:MoaA/NifB/PqqE/SkfB family radical SAM enzyme